MHDELDIIVSLQRRLGVYRRTIEFLELQRAQFGAFTPAYIWHQFDETRSEIARVKSELRDQGVLIADLPGDIEAPSSDAAIARRTDDSSALLSVYQRMVADQVRYLSVAGMCGWSDLSLQLADLYVERTLTALGAANSAGSQSAEQNRPASTLADLVSHAGARILLEGALGSGKTTSLAMLALACADPAGADLVANWPSPAPLPLLLSASELAMALARTDATPDTQRMPSLAAFWSAIEEWLQYSNLKALVPTIQQLLERGGCLVLIDGIDDLPAIASPQAFIAALGRFVARYPDNRYVVTCRRFHASVMSPLASFNRFTLPALDPPLIDAMVARWYAAVADRAGWLMAEDVASRVAMLRGLLHGDARFQALAQSPLTLALCILAHAEGHALPVERGIVLRRLAELLLNGWDHSRFAHTESLSRAVGLAALDTPERGLALLEPLALALQSRPDNGRAQGGTLGYVELDALLAHGLAGFGVDQRQASDQMIPELLARCCRYGLLAYAGPGLYTMPQRQVREYLAARALAALPDFPTRAYTLRQEPRWHETLLHALHELGRRSTPHVARLLIRLLLHPPDGDRQLPAKDLLLAAESLLAIGARSQPDRALRAEVQERLIAFMDAGSPTIEKRIQAGLLLGQLGDPRFAGPLPPLAEIAAGPFILGTSDGYEDEGPEQWVDLPAFAIGSYPVTNQEYAAFLAANPMHPPPHYWHDLRYNNPACPVVGVTWNDAIDYCAWLTGRLTRAGLLPAGQVARLPLEAEWEKAASWDAQAHMKRRYPWGDEWSSTHANTLDGRGNWMTVPVGCYPAGISAYGLHDCIGNVWEWTASVYASYPGAPTPFDERDSYTLRGSSCASTPTHARGTYRSRLPAGYWRYHLGFRIVLGRPLDTPPDPAQA